MTTILMATRRLPVRARSDHLDHLDADERVETHYFAPLRVRLRSI